MTGPQYVALMGASGFAVLGALCLAFAAVTRKPAVRKKDPALCRDCLFHKARFVRGESEPACSLLPFRSLAESRSYCKGNFYLDKVRHNER